MAQGHFGRHLWWWWRFTLGHYQFMNPSEGNQTCNFPSPTHLSPSSSSSSSQLSPQHPWICSFATSLWTTPCSPSSPPPSLDPLCSSNVPVWQIWDTWPQMCYYKWGLQEKKKKEYEGGVLLNQFTITGKKCFPLLFSFLLCIDLFIYFIYHRIKPWTEPHSWTFLKAHVFDADAGFTGPIPPFVALKPIYTF